MPSEKIEKSFVLKSFNNIMEQNNSQAELVRESAEETGGEHERSWADVKWTEWVSVMVLCYVNLINYMDRYTVAGVLEDIQADLTINGKKGVNNDLAGLLQTAFIVFYMIFGPIFGYLGDRYSRKWLMAFGVTLWSLTTLCGSFMTNYWFFLLFRAMVGIGEASYSTIAPTILSDFFVGDIRSKMLALFYFAIPVGSGLGYIVGAETAKLLGNWQWALRVTPVLGVGAVLVIVLFLREPERGASEGGGHMEATSWMEDVKEIVKCKSFVLSTAGFTCVAFVAGALAWWGPKYIEKGAIIQGRADQVDGVSFRFGIVGMLSGLIGVPLGSMVAQRLRHRFRRIDAYICGIGLLISCPFIFVAILVANYSTTLCFTMCFFGELFFNLTWSIVADILLYVIMPLRRSTAEGFQLLISHALGDAGSPYLIGVLSEAFRIMLEGKTSTTTTTTPLSNLTVTSTTLATPTQADYNEFKALQYALFTTCFIEVIGALFFLLNALYIVEDKEKVDRAIHAENNPPLGTEQSDPLAPTQTQNL
ncbi:protein spinster isoform X3 [Anthonomus grandis grandis]|uniref:protein spinster isoform X2 n=1 Tax=Anthonomus grandis grandis TaxID=2921223 RepID=UPI0021654B15|nr:protein spinster isoform X2 [Anthonomus grandis grandis]XP_050311312.1 protein spinster isoform X3 [Anthonomus grandis grandis]